MSRIYISAAHKSSGKTTISIGLCAALTQKGMKVQPFKKGPDYIDPLWLARASGLAKENDLSGCISDIEGCYNLDFNTQSKQEILQTLTKHSHQADISIIEGNKGLYDGVALDGSDSNAAMVKLTQSPVVLVIDTRGITRGVAPLLLGYQQFDPEVDIAGVIFNLAGGERHENKLRAITEEYTDIPVLGVIRKNSLMELDERHLGLMPSNEDQQANQKINEIERIVSDSVDLSKLLELAKHAPEFTVPITTNITAKKSDKVRIGICEDAAFGFYYADDKQALIEAGAELVSINTLQDESLPNGIDAIDGLFIGGGFPETHMQQLAQNKSMLKSIHDAIEAGLPTYAECGGLMYLTRSIEWQGQTAKLVGVIPADTQMHEKPQGRGHVKLEETDDMPWTGTSNGASYGVANAISGDINQRPLINAHEFHYSRLINFTQAGKFAYKVHRGVGITGEKDGWVYKNLLANYSHLRSTDSFQWANQFIGFIQNQLETKRRL